MSDENEFLKDGLIFTRITHILDYFMNPGLADWMIKVGRKEAKRVSTIAMKIGTEVDLAIKAGMPPKKFKSLEAENCYSAYLLWGKDYSPTLSVGERLYDVERLVTGEPDLFWDDTVIDIKCSSQIRPSYWLQTEFYGRLSGMKNKAILRLDKNLREYQFKKMALNDEHWEACCGLIKAYRLYNEDQA